MSIIEVNLNHDPLFRILPTPVSTGQTPFGIAVSPDSKYVFVTNYEDNSVTVFGGKSPFQLLPPRFPPATKRNAWPFRLTAATFFVPNRSSGKLSVIDTANASLFNVIQGPTLFPEFDPDRFALLGMAASPDGHYVFVSDANSHLWVIHVEVGANPPYRVLSPALGVGAGPRGVAVSLDGHYVFVANTGDSSVSVIEVSSGPSFQVLSPPLSIEPPPVVDDPLLYLWRFRRMAAVFS